MKMIEYSKYLALAIALVTVAGCDDAKLSTIDNGLYIEEAAPSNTFGQQIEAQLVDEGDVMKTLTVRLVRAINQDVTVTLDIDQQLITDIIIKMKRLMNFCRKSLGVLNVRLQFLPVKYLPRLSILP